MNDTPPILVERATAEDLPWLCEHDAHVDRGTLARKVAAGEVLVSRLASSPVGWLRFGMFWDTIPFMNMLVVLEGYRGRGIGRQLVTSWEAEMRRLGHQRVMTSTQSNESAQHFYRHLGYIDTGCLLLPAEPLEVLFAKPLG